MTSGRRAKARRKAVDRQARHDFAHLSESEKAQLVREGKGDRGHLGLLKAKPILGRRIDVHHGVCKRCGRTGYLDSAGICEERSPLVNMDRHAQGLRPLRSRTKKCRELAEEREKKAKAKK